MCSSKDWWKVAKQIRGQNFQIGVQIGANEFKHYFNTLLNPPQVSNNIQYAAMLIMIWIEQSVWMKYTKY